MKIFSLLLLSAVTAGAQTTVTKFHNSSDPPFAVLVPSNTVAEVLTVATPVNNQQLTPWVSTVSGSNLAPLPVPATIVGPLLLSFTGQGYFTYRLTPQTSTARIALEQSADLLTWTNSALFFRLRVER